MISRISEQAEEVMAIKDYIPEPISARKPEICIVEVPSIIIVIETGFGYYSCPMLVIETKMNAEIRDWSSQVWMAKSNEAIVTHKKNKTMAYSFTCV